MKKEKFKVYLEEQKKLIDAYKWDRGVQLGRDPGQDAIQEWISKYAKKFRKDFALKDLKEGLQELRDIQCQVQDYLQKINQLQSVVAKCEEVLLEGLELLESESDDNGPK